MIQNSIPSSLLLACGASTDATPLSPAGAGVFLLASAESEQISFLLDCLVRGVSPSRGPFGLQPLLPGQ